MGIIVQKYLDTIRLPISAYSILLRNKENRLVHSEKTEYMTFGSNNQTTCNLTMLGFIYFENTQDKQKENDNNK